MSIRRILSIQDISCLGQCSMTVAMPILSVCGLETCILPTMVLSTHTGGLGIPHRRDLTEDLLPIASHWRQQGIRFDGISVGYLGRAEQVQKVMKIVDELLAVNGKLIVDPAMADHGKLYGGIDPACVKEMETLCHKADVLLPNLTEACLLTESDYMENPTPSQIQRLLDDLEGKFDANVLLTGVGFKPGETGFALRRSGVTAYYHHDMVGGAYHGTGDMFAAVFTGAFLQGKDAYDAAVMAAGFVSKVAEKTARDPAHAYGTRFEWALPWLAQQFENE